MYTAHVCRHKCECNVFGHTHCQPLSISTSTDEAISADVVQHVTLDNRFLGSHGERIIDCAYYNRPY